MTWTLVLLGVVLAGLILGTIPQLQGPLKPVAAIGAIIVLCIFLVLSSFRFVGDDEVAVIVRNVGAKSLPEGQILATAGEMGPQAKTLAPGWHPFLWPVIFNLEIKKQLEIPDDKVGLVLAKDGVPLPPGQVFAPEWSQDDFQQMLNAEYFLTKGKGFKGPQTSVLRPGKYRLNHRLFEVQLVPVTDIIKATVGVVKSNVGDPVIEGPGAVSAVVPKGSRGIWKTPLYPSKQYLNTKAYEVTSISTAQQTVMYVHTEGKGGEREITVRSRDGFTFPVDVRVEYQIEPRNAPIVVAEFSDDKDKLSRRLTSVVRAVFRDNAEGVNALDYVRQRSEQATQSMVLLAQQMAPYGVTIKAVRIGDVASDGSLQELLKTQTDREIAVQEQITFQEQQRAAEQRKALTRTQQEAEEEKRLATAQYQVQISEQEKQQTIIGAEAQAEQIRIEAEAQAEAFRVIAEQIGQGNAALIELLKVVGERGIQITPRVMVVGGDGKGAGASSSETTALIGTMLDSMISRNAKTQAKASDN